MSVRVDGGGRRWCAACLLMVAGCAAPGNELRYELKGGEIRTPLTQAAPDAERGRKVLISRESNCILCHAVPETGERFYGNLAPPLSGVGQRLSAAQLRARIVDPLYFNKETIMPAYYRVKGLNRVAESLRGKPVLSAEQIEDVIAYLLTLK
jgi:L-cysteine S-thiosulfotransferase